MRSVLHFAALLLGSAILARAQVAAPVAPRQAGDDEPVRLSEFRVTDSGTGYLASEAVTGSRVKERIKDLPYSVNVVTSEFLKDFMFLEFNDDFGYVSGLSNMDPGGGYNLRGVGATKSLRDGFQRFGLNDPATIDRIEIIKGPAASIYGETRPGGLINVISKEPKTNPAQSLTVQSGSYHTWRTTADATGPIAGLKKTYYLLIASAFDRHFDRPYAYVRQQTLMGSVTHLFPDGTRLWVEAEWIKRPSNGLSQLALVDNGIADPTHRYTRLATELRDFSPVGPINHTNRENSQFTGSLEHRISDIWNLKLAASWFNRDYWNFTSGRGQSYNPVTRQITGRVPGMDNINERGGGFSTDVLANYPLHGGKLRTSTLFTLDYNVYLRTDPSWHIPDLTPYVNAGRYYPNLSVDHPNYAVIWPFNTRDYSQIVRWNDDRTDDIGLAFRQQVSAFDDKLIASASGRFDEAIYWLRDKAAAMQTGNPALTGKAYFDEGTFEPGGGISYEAVKDIRFYANLGSSFFADSQAVRLSAAQPREGGFGFDYGVKGSFLNDKLNGTLAAYYARQTNVQVMDLDENGFPVTRYEGGRLTRGFELDVNWQASPNATLLANYSFSNARISQNGRDLDSVGRHPTQAPENSASLVCRYIFLTGTLKGLNVNLGMAYFGKSWIDAVNGGIVDPRTGLILSNDGRRNITLPAYTLVNLGLQYEYRPGKSHYTHTFGVNAKNLLDKRYISSGRYVGDRLGVYFSYTIGHSLKR